MGYHDRVIQRRVGTLFHIMSAASQLRDQDNDSQNLIKQYPAKQCISSVFPVLMELNIYSITKNQNGRSFFRLGSRQV
jgi:hypothetical protein